MKRQLHHYIYTFAAALAVLAGQALYAVPNAQAQAQVVVPTVEVTPAIIDDQAMARDILKYQIKLKGIGDRKMGIYTFVNNISVEEGQQEFLAMTDSDKSTSLANWIEISRANRDISPGEEVTLDMTIKVNLWAKPGKYHAMITFAEGSNREQAEKKLATSPKTMVTLEIVEDVREILELHNFAPEKKFITGSEAGFEFTLDNTGNKELNPEAEIRIYDRRGAEVANIDANPDGNPVQPGESVDWQASWQDVKKFGQYKAMIMVSYGTADIDRLQDTVYFYIIPKSVMIIGIAVVSVLVILILLAVFYLPRKYEPPAFLPDAVEEIYEHLPWHHHHSRLQELYESHNLFADALVELEEHMPGLKKSKLLKDLHNHHWDLMEELADLTDELAEHLPWHHLEEEDEAPAPRKTKAKKASKKSDKKQSNKKTVKSKTAKKPAKKNVKTKGKTK